MRPMAASPDPWFLIGELSRRTGIPVRTIRYYSDIGLAPEAARDAAGRRRYDSRALARLEMARTLRELGFDLAAVRRVLDRQDTLAALAERHARALDAQIDVLRLRRAVLRAVAKRGPTLEETGVMSKLARLSEAERKAIIDECHDEVFGGLDIDPGFERRMRSVSPDLPADPAPEQVEAWVELATLARDPSFRARVRQMAQAHSDSRAAGQDPSAGVGAGAEGVIAERAGVALARGVAPDSAEAGGVIAGIVDEIRGGEPDTPGLRGSLAERFAIGCDHRVERYWQLMGAINGWPPAPSVVPAFEWAIAALQAHPDRG